MNKSNTIGMRLHQALSFSSFFLRVPDAQAIFWPGCALMGLDPDILNKTLNILRRAEPNIVLAAGCCAQPTKYVFPQDFRSRQEKLEHLLQKQGVRRIYTACPNCTQQLKAIPGIIIIPIWSVLADNLKPEDIQSVAGRFIIHDPCVTRTDAEQQQAVRKLLSLCNCDYTEPAHSGAKTICCGNFRMMHTLNPEAADKMRNKRLAEFPADRTIISNCEGCLSSFRSCGRQGLHLLEVLFGKSQSHSWSNRIKTAMSIKN